MIEEGRFSDFYHKARKKVLKQREKKKDEKEKTSQPPKAMDAGARLRRLQQRREYAAKISGSTDNVPDDIRDHKEYKKFDL